MSIVIVTGLHFYITLPSVDVSGGGKTSDMKKATENLKDPRFKKAGMDGLAKKSQDPRFGKPGQQKSKDKKELPKGPQSNQNKDHSAPKKQQNSSSLASEKDGGYINAASLCCSCSLRSREGCGGPPNQENC